MIRTFALALSSVALFSSLAPIEAQWRGPYQDFARHIDDPLPGVYANVSGGGTCEVRLVRRGYLFVNENGSQALFVYSSPGQLRMIDGSWNPNIDVTVSKDRRGRTVIRFEEPFQAPGFWVSQ